jgi:hypothetical protein
MEKSNKRGKIPQQDWPSIMARYDAGETLASIARTYDCSPPAISYIVSRSRVRNANGEAPRPVPAAVPSEPQLVKSHAVETPQSEPPKSESAIAIPLGAPPPRDVAFAATAHGDGGRRRDPPHALDPRSHHGNGAGGRLEAAERESNRTNPLPNDVARSFVANAVPSIADVRGTLHLSLGNDAAQPAEAPAAYHAAAPSAPERLAPRPGPGPQRASGHGGAARFPAEQDASPAGAPAQADRDAVRSRDGGSFIDHALRTRVDGDIAAFLAAFDAALARDTLESRASLREATDRLLRAGARTRIELERLEARVPLPPRDALGHEGPAWRHR